MDDNEQDQFNRDCDRVLAATEGVNQQDIFDVLMAVMSHHLRCVDPDRRPAAKRYIEQELPSALANADIDDATRIRDAFAKGLLVRH
jgi:hypothetical protein